MYFKLCLILILLFIIVESRRPLNPLRSIKLRKRILGIHNRFRTMAKPTARNMLALKWSKEAAQMAQNHANSCQFGVHSTNPSRESKKFKQCGENISIFDVRDPRADWFHAIQLWFDERKLFQYNGDLKAIQRDFLRVGHYTTLMWATTSHVGCGYQKCVRDRSGRRRNFSFHNFVCVYCPGGNHPNYLNKPYKEGEPCADCPNHCYNKSLCLNNCNYVNKYDPEYCDKDTGKLFRWNPTGCKKNAIRNTQCPATCKCGKKKIYW